MFHWTGVTTKSCLNVGFSDFVLIYPSVILKAVDLPCYSHFTPKSLGSAHFLWLFFQLQSPPEKALGSFFLHSKDSQIYYEGASLVISDKESTADAVDTDSIPDPGRSHMLQSN